MHILIVDDDEDIREVLALVLAALGHQVDVAADGQEALHQLRSGLTPQLILLDLMMPRLDGEGLVNEMRADPRLAAIPFCLLTGHPSARDKAEQLGAVGCLVKPVELEQLEAILPRAAAAAAHLSG